MNEAIIKIVVSKNKCIQKSLSICVFILIQYQSKPQKFYLKNILNLKSDESDLQFSFAFKTSKHTSRFVVFKVVKQLKMITLYGKKQETVENYGCTGLLLLSQVKFKTCMVININNFNRMITQYNSYLHFLLLQTSQLQIRS